MKQYDNLFCGECESDEPIYEMTSGDEGWTYCPACQSVEGGTYERPEETENVT